MPEILSAGLIGLAFVIVTVAVALAAYGAMRFIAVHLIDDKTHDLSASVAFRVAALHALILALIFAQEAQNNRELRNGLVAEATAVADLFDDIARYQGQYTQDLRLVIARYTQSVPAEDWPELRKTGRLSEAGHIHWEAIYRHVLDLEPENRRQDALRDQMLEDVHTIAELRQARINAAANPISNLFWLAAIGGVIFVSVPYFVYPARPLNVALLVMFAAYTGLVLYVIFAFSDPFSPPVVVEPTPFIKLLEAEIGEWVIGVPDG